MNDQKLWEMAKEQAIKEYEENIGPWEDTDKYEREDWIVSIYLELKNASKKGV